MSGNQYVDSASVTLWVEADPLGAYLDVTPQPDLRSGTCATVGGDMWFPDVNPSTNDRENTAQAKRFCQACPVRQACLQYAIDNNLREGIWGGLDRLERNAVKRQRVAA